MLLLSYYLRIKNFVHYPLVILSNKVKYVTTQTYY